MNKPDEMGLTPESAQGYEDLFVPAIFNQWPPKIIEAADLGAGDHLLEVGCGTGVLADSVNETALDAVVEGSQTHLAAYCSESGSLNIPLNAIIAVAKRVS